MNKVSVLIADDHYLVRLGLKTLVDSYPDFEVVREVENGQQVLEHLEAASFFILDLNMPVLGGLETLIHIRKKGPDKKVIILTNTMDVPSLLYARKQKPDGILFKDDMHQEIEICLQQIRKGHYYYSQKFLAFLQENDEEIEFVENFLRNLESLTQTEVRILLEISHNLSTSEIAEALYNSPKTIDNHRTNIARKLDISGYNSLQVVALKYQKFIESFYSSFSQSGKK